MSETPRGLTWHHVDAVWFDGSKENRLLVALREEHSPTEMTEFLVDLGPGGAMRFSFFADIKDRRIFQASILRQEDAALLPESIPWIFLEGPWKRGVSDVL